MDACMLGCTKTCHFLTTYLLLISKQKNSYILLQIHTFIFPFFCFIVANNLLSNFCPLSGCYYPRHATNRDMLLLATLR